MPNTKPSPLLDQLLARSLAYPLGTSARYAVASLVITAVGLFRALLIASIVPWLLFIPAVLAVALMLGRAPGLYASVLAAVIAGLSIGRDSEPLWLTPSQWAGTIVFVAVSASIAVFGGELRATFERAASGSEAFSIGNEAVLFLQEAGGGVILGLLIGWISDKSADGYVRALWCRKCQPR